jgi:exodeoxyribonuclease-3
LRVITLNVNGIRSAAKKGLFRWLAAQKADVVCLQELKCHEADLDAKLHGLKAFESCHAFAQKKGYSGVAIYSRRTPDEVRRGFAAHDRRQVNQQLGEIASLGKFDLVVGAADDGSQLSRIFNA